MPQGERTDTNLVHDWIEKQKAQRRSYAFVADRKQLAAVSPNDTDYLLGLFSHDHMTYAPKRVPGTASDQEPTHMEMAMKAIDVLEKDPNGYFLLIEGGRIDIAHHEGTPHIAMEETLKFDETIQAVYERVNGRPPIDYYFEAKQQHKPEERDTLVVVTADHSHVFSVGGYPVRGNPIFGFNRESFDKPYELSDVDGLPYTVLNYGNGPGGKAPRSNITSVDTSLCYYVSPNFVIQRPLTPDQTIPIDGTVNIYADADGCGFYVRILQPNSLTLRLTRDQDEIQLGPGSIIGDEVDDVFMRPRVETPVGIMQRYTLSIRIALGDTLTIEPTGVAGVRAQMAVLDVTP